MKFIKVLLIAMTAIYPAISMADIKTDKNAGDCAAYLLALKKGEQPEIAQKALQMADNQKRAEVFMGKWFDDFKRAGSITRDGMIFDATSSCYDIGMKVSDYHKFD